MLIIQGAWFDVYLYCPYSDVDNNRVKIGVVINEIPF